MLVRGLPIFVGLSSAELMIPGRVGYQGLGCEEERSLGRYSLSGLCLATMVLKGHLLALWPLAVVVMYWRQ